MAYELWEAAAGNIVATLSTADGALAVVRESVRAYGPEYVDSWLLAREDENGETELIAEGPELVRLATDTDGDQSHTRSA